MAECIRLYNDGTHITNVRETKEETESWLEYNKKYRFGTALFINGKCVDKGVYISKERCDAFEKELLQRRKHAPSNLLFSFDNQDVASRFIDGMIAIPNMGGVTIKIVEDTPKFVVTDNAGEAAALICELGVAMDKRADISLWAYNNQARIRTVCLAHSGKP